MKHRAYRAALVIALMLGSCTPDVEEQAEEARAAARDAIESVMEAWAESDPEGLAAASRDPDGAAELVRHLARALEEGRITEFEVAVDGAVPEPSPEEIEERATVEIEVPYVIEWTSEAAVLPAELEGSIAMTYDVEADGWTTPLDRSLLWPGIEGARGFDVAHEWLKRGTIKDRQGRIIARGSGERRRYPFGSIGGSTVGHVGTSSRAELEQTEEFDADDLVGASGIEQAFQERLGGAPTLVFQAIGRKGRVIEVLGRTNGVPGEDVKVTLDMEIQRAAEEAYGDTVGGAVVMQPSSGDLLAIVDSSSFDPNNYVGAKGIEPFNRALVGGYPPGSSMKVVTAAAALDTGTVTPDTTVTGPKEYKGVRNFESGKFGSIPFSSAVKFSVNTAFAQIAERLGAKKMTKYANRFGFNRPVDMALQARQPSYPEPVGLADLMWSAVGQAQVLATPLQMATVAATVANGGKRMEPRIDMHARMHGERAMSRGTASELTEMMRSVVEGGTGVNARIAGIAVAGKTGTAEVDVAGERRNHAWFICFAPVGAERLAVAVVSEYGGVGGQVAAPLARAILQRTLPLAPSF